MLWPPLRVTLPDLSGPRADSRPVVNDSDVERRAPVFHSLLTLPRVFHKYGLRAPYRTRIYTDLTDLHGRPTPCQSVESVKIGVPYNAVQRYVAAALKYLTIAPELGEQEVLRR